MKLASRRIFDRSSGIASSTPQSASFFPSQVLQLLSCPRNRIQCWKATPGSGPWRLEFRIEILWGRGGPHAAGTSSNIFKRQKCDFFHRFFRDRSVRHKDSQSVILRNRFWRRISATGRSRRKFYFTFCYDSAHMRSLDGGSLHDSTKSPKNRNPRFWHSKNRHGARSQHFGRVGSSYMARLKAKIELNNMQKCTGRTPQAATL